MKCESLSNSIFEYLLYLLADAGEQNGCSIKDESNATLHLSNRGDKT